MNYSVEYEPEALADLERLTQVVQEVTSLLSAGCVKII